MRLLLAGGSGLVGSRLVRCLANQDMCLIGRRIVDDAPGNPVQLTGPVDQWPALMRNVEADVAICALGTTMAKAGSRQAFAAIDLDAVALFASAAKASGARQFLMISSTGADPVSPNFYLSVKGKAEAAVAALNFERCDIFRPGLLRGDRGSERRIGERSAILLSPIVDRLIPARFDRYRSIAADDVAAAISAMIGKPGTGLHIHHNREMLTATA